MGIFPNAIEFVEGLTGSMGVAGLFFISLIEAIFFPIPPDAMLLPMAASRPALALVYAFVATTGSVFGAIISYYLGLKGGRPLLARFASGQRIESVRRLISRWDMWAVGIAGFTPLPFKVMAIAAGVFRLPLRRFVFASVLSRSARFFLEAWLVELFGPRVVTFITSYFEAITTSMAVAAAIAYWVYRRWRQKRKHAQ